MEHNSCISLDDLLSNEITKDIIIKEVRNSITKTFDKIGMDLVISNAVHRFLDSKLDEIVPEYGEKIIDNASRIINDTTMYRYHIFRYHYSSGNPESTAAKIIEQVINDNKSFIRQRVLESIANIDQSDEFCRRLDMLGEQFASNIYDLVDVLRSSKTNV